MTKAQREARIKVIEGRYSIGFLEQSLHGEAVEWRQITSPNAASFDGNTRTRDEYTGQFACNQDFQRMCVCGHRLGSHGWGGFDCLVATGIPQFMDDDNSRECACVKFRQSRRKSVKPAQT